MPLKQTTGSRAQVMHGTAKKTTGGLTKSQLKYNKQGKIVSKKASALAKKNNRLVKAGVVENQTIEISKITHYLIENPSYSPHSPYSTKYIYKRHRDIKKALNSINISDDTLNHYKIQFIKTTGMKNATKSNINKRQNALKQLLTDTVIARAIWKYKIQI